MLKYSGLQTDDLTTIARAVKTAGNVFNVVYDDDIKKTEN